MTKLYHGTSSKYLKSILKVGLIKNKSNPSCYSEKYIYLSKDIKGAMIFAEAKASETKSKPIILEIDVSSLIIEKPFQTYVTPITGFITKRRILPKLIKVVEVEKSG